MSPTIPILLYHSVTDAPATGFEEFTVGLTQFAAHLDRIADLGCTPMTVGALAARLRSGDPVPAGAVAITFDDGFADFATHAWPALHARTMPATLYMIAGAIGGTYAPGPAIAPMPMLSAPGLRALAAEGLEIGAHTWSHPQLDCLATDDAHREIVAGKQALEDCLGSPVTTFAYPHGYHDRRTKESVAAAGFTSAVAVRNALSHRADDLFALARVTITGGCTADRIERIVCGSAVRRAHPRELLRTTMWRRIRRLNASATRAVS